MARQGKKQQKKLERRIADWKSMKDDIDEKNKKGTYNETYYRKPGSLRK